MSVASVHRKLPWDWYGGTIPENVSVDDSAYLETSYSFLLYRSELPAGVSIGRGFERRFEVRSGRNQGIKKHRTDTLLIQFPYSRAHCRKVTFTHGTIRTHHRNNEAFGTCAGPQR